MELYFSKYSHVGTTPAQVMDSLDTVFKALDIGTAFLSNSIITLLREDKDLDRVAPQNRRQPLFIFISTSHLAKSLMENQAEFFSLVSPKAWTKDLRLGFSKQRLVQGQKEFDALSLLLVGNVDLRFRYFRSPRFEDLCTIVMALDQPALSRPHFKQFLRKYHNFSLDIAENTFPQEDPRFSIQKNLMVPWLHAATDYQKQQTEFRRLSHLKYARFVCSKPGCVVSHEVSREHYIELLKDPRCGSTLLPGGGKLLRRCSGSGAVRYCSAECQKADWLVHKSGKLWKTL